MWRITWAGYTYLCRMLRETDKNWYHHLHLQYFNLNYGNTPTPFDKLFGSWHDGSKESLMLQKERIRDRRLNP